jgi:hypothetical protein
MNEVYLTFIIQSLSHSYICVFFFLGVAVLSGASIPILSQVMSTISVILLYWFNQI